MTLRGGGEKSDAYLQVLPEDMYALIFHERSSCKANKYGAINIMTSMLRG